jgi:hypothetical protein
MLVTRQCSNRAVDRCRLEAPALREVVRELVACHLR